MLLGAIDSQEVPACRSLLAAGDAGIVQTLDAMARAAMGKWGAASPRLRELALAIVREAGAAERDQRAEVEAIHQWMQRSIRYVYDPVGVEFVSQPEHLAFVQRDGDCDDFSVLEAALLGTLGIVTRFVVVGVRSAAFEHVYLEARIGARWIPLDPIVKHQPAGWEVPNPKRRMALPPNHPNGLRLGPSLSSLALGIGAALALWKGTR